MDRLRGGTVKHSDVVDRRAMVNPNQATQLLAAVRRIHPSLEAYFACLPRRPQASGSTVRKRRDLRLPDHGWGSLLLVDSTPSASSSWTDTARTDEDRQLKHRARRETRLVPAPPELVD